MSEPLVFTILKDDSPAEIIQRTMELRLFTECLQKPPRLQQKLISTLRGEIWQDVPLMVENPKNDR
jgi:hypothetical protein